MDKKQINFLIIIFIFLSIFFWLNVFLVQSTSQIIFSFSFISLLLILFGSQIIHISDKFKKNIYYSFLVSLLVVFVNRVFNYSIYLPDLHFLWNFEYSFIFWTVLSGMLSLSFLPTAQPSKLKTKTFLIIIITISLLWIILRLRNLGHLWFVNDEGFTALYSYLINQSWLPCDFGTWICYSRWFPYHYFVSLFTYFLWVNEFSIRFPNILIFIGILFYLYKFLTLIKTDKKIIILIFLLTCFADFNLVLTDLARFYTLGLLFFLMFLYYYYRSFVLDQKPNYFLLGMSAILGIFTFEYNVVLLYFLIDPLVTQKLKLYKSCQFWVMGGLILLATIAANLRPVYFYLDPGYIWYTGIATSITSIIQRFSFDLFYIDLLFKYLPFLIVFGCFWVLFFVKHEKQQRTLLYFLLFCLLSFVFYKSQWFARYARGFYSILFIIFAYGFFYLNISKNLKILLLTWTLIVNLWNIYYIKTLEYGSKTDKNFFLSTLPIEKYYPDDKSFVEYLNKNYTKWDIIIFDYRIQEVYLKLSGFDQPDYVITDFGPVDYIKTYSNIKIYKDKNQYFLYKNWTKFITNREELSIIVQKNFWRNIFYISSADFNGQKNHSISNKNLYDYINIFCKPVFVAQDKNTKIFELSKNNCSW